MSTSEMHRPVNWSDRPDEIGGASGGDASPHRGTTGRLRFEPDRSCEDRLQLEARSESIALGRHHVRRALRRLIPTERLGVTVVDALSADLELAASELVTNAVEHAAGESLEVSLSCDGTTVALEVMSHGAVDQVDPARDWQIADIASVTGRGLGIVRALSDRVTVDRDHDNLSIRIERDLPN